MQGEVRELEITFGLKPGALRDIKLHFALFGGEGYEDWCFIVFGEEGKLYSVSAFHCSCNDYEDQWCPEEETWEALGMKTFQSYEYEKEDVDKAKAIIAEHLEGKSE